MVKNDQIELTKDDLQKLTADYFNILKWLHVCRQSEEDQWEKDKANTKNRREVRRKEVRQPV